MSDVKIRIRASSFGDYFGVGFNTPEERLRMDMSGEEQEFDQASLERMELGTCLENGVLDFFEFKYGITITDRNTERLDIHDGLISGKLDGMTIYKDVETVVECKVSNSATGFVDSIGYNFQVQAYMYEKNCSQALLLGLKEGKPTAKLIKRDDEVIADILEMAESIAAIHMGLDDTYPWHLVEKYTKTKANLGEVSATTDEDEMIKQYKELSNQEKVIKEAKQEIVNYFKETYQDDCKVRGSIGAFNISTSPGRTTFDKELFQLENPDIDLSEYNKTGSEIRNLRLVK